MATGFTVVNHFITAYEKATKKRLPGMGDKAKVHFNQRVYVIKDKYDWDSQDLIALIDFMYKHNPLGLENIAKYGKIESLLRSAPFFIAWQRDNPLNEHETLREAVERLRPELAAVDKKAADMNDQFAGAIRRDLGLAV